MYDPSIPNGANGTVPPIPVIVDPSHPNNPVPVVNIRPDTGENPVENMSGLDMEKAGIEEKFDEESATFMDDQPVKPRSK